MYTRSKIKLVRGIGINDADSPTQKFEKVNGVWKQVWICPYYRKWRSMLNRCFKDKSRITVCKDWLVFSNFKNWVDAQPVRGWEDCHLDKDLLVSGNTTYSPDTCAFISGKVNGFLLDGESSRGDYLIGVCWKKKNNKFTAQCNNPFNDERGYLGLYDTEEDAHYSWKKKKHEYACLLADTQEDIRVKTALLNRYKY